MGAPQHPREGVRQVGRRGKGGEVVRRLDAIVQALPAPWGSDARLTLSNMRG
jgi:hypothetical protein